MFEGCNGCDYSQYSPLVQGFYFESKANLETADKMLLRAVNTFKVAAQAYTLAELTLNAWSQSADCQG